MDKQINVLFVCTRNSCRSQMAEGWAKKLFSDSIKAQSAGIEKSTVDSLAIQVMQEKNIDISQQTSKLIDDLELNSFDYVVILCDEAETRCPNIPSHIQRLYKPIDDPKKFKASTPEENLKNYRRVRDEIHKLIIEIQITVLRDIYRFF